MNTLKTILVYCLFGVGVAASQPQITSFSPLSGVGGTSVTITGSGFDGATMTNNIVYFGTAKATVTSASATSLTVTVPSGATLAPVTVTTGGLTAFSKKSFVVTFNALAQIDSSFFGSSVSYSVSPATGTSGVAEADIDGDGKPDLITVNAGNGTLNILRNTGSPGGFVSSSFSAPGASYPAGTNPAYLAVGDLDGDGDLDIAVSDSSSGNVYVWLNGSTSGVIDSTSMTSIHVGTTPYGIAIDDIDIDGKPDLLVAKKNVDSVSVLLNEISLPTVSFARTDFYTGSGTNPVEVRPEADIDGDGQIDVVAIGSGNSRICLLLNTGSFDGTASLGGSQLFTVGTGPSSLVLVDADGDGKTDIVSSNYTAGTISLLRNTSSLGSPSFAAKVDVDAGSSPFKIAASDLNGDGKPDLVVTNRLVDSITVFQNAAPGPGPFTSSTFAPHVQFHVGVTPSGLTLGDVDGDGKPEIVVGNEASNNIAVFRNKAVRVVAETGNDSSSATLMSVGETIQSILDAGTDVDYMSFILNPGDTVSIDLHAANNTNVTVQDELRDTSGVSIYKYPWQTVKDTQSWYVFAPSIISPRKYLLRITSQYNNGSFPNARPEDGRPALVGGSVAAPDSGYYQVSIERFTPSAPKIYYYSGVYNLSYNRGWWWTDVYPNGLSTDVNFEYSLSSDLSGSTIIPATGSPGSGINRTYFPSFFTGLTPNTKYYYRMSATNALGTAYSQVSYFVTPPSPVGWVHQNNGSASTITGIAYGDDTTGVSVGYGGSNAWRRTTDGGSTWTTFSNPASSNLYGVTMVNSLLGYAVGNGESIIKTTDGGALWTAQTGTGAGSDLWRVRFVNAISGMAVGAGGLIIKTGNGGTTWTQSRAPGGYDLRGLDYADLNTIVAVGGNGTILRSPDGGATWDSIPSPTTAFLYGVDFVSQNVGFIVGNMGIMKTVNGGLSWNILSLPDYTSFYDIAFKDANNGIVVGVQGYILRTTDGGATWKKQITGTETYLNAAAYRGRSLAAAGDNGLVLSALDPQTESEPNDSPGSAQLVAYRDDVDAKIDPGDTDYYKFVASGADTIAIFVQSRDSAVVNGVLNLLDVALSLPQPPH